MWELRGVAVVGAVVFGVAFFVWGGPGSAVGLMASALVVAATGLVATRRRARAAPRRILVGMSAAYAVLLLVTTLGLALSIKWLVLLAGATP